MAFTFTTTAEEAATTFKDQITGKNGEHEPAYDALGSPDLILLVSYYHWRQPQLSRKGDPSCPRSVCEDNHRRKSLKGEVSRNSERVRFYLPIDQFL